MLLLPQFSAEEVEKIVQCAYLSVVDWWENPQYITDEYILISTHYFLHMECRNIVNRGPKFGCDFWKNGECLFRSREADKTLLHTYGHPDFYPF